MKTKQNTKKLKNKTKKKTEKRTHSYKRVARREVPWTSTLGFAITHLTGWSNTTASVNFDPASWRKPSDKTLSLVFVSQIWIRLSADSALGHPYQYLYHKKTTNLKYVLLMIMLVFVLNESTFKNQFTFLYLAYFWLKRILNS